MAFSFLPVSFFLFCFEENLTEIFFFLFQSSPGVSGPVNVEMSESLSLLLPLLILLKTDGPITTEQQTKGRPKENFPSSGLNPKGPQTETQTTYLPLVILLTCPHMHNLLNHRLLKHRVWMTYCRTTNTRREKYVRKSFGKLQEMVVCIKPEYIMSVLSRRDSYNLYVKCNSFANLK